MSPLRFARLLVPAAAFGIALSPALAGVQAQKYGTLFFQTNLGSFKLLGVGDSPAEGKIQVTFTGTLLIDQRSLSDPKVSVDGGNIRREFSKPDRLQEAYHGTGTMTIQGHFTSIQWFGRDMHARWDGFGIGRLVGEFDKDLKTGTYYYSANPSDIHEWGAQMAEVTNPPNAANGAYQVLPHKRGG